MMNGKREFGDYQTPRDFAEKVCSYLKEVRHVCPSAIIEPTCGIGSFLESSLMFDAGEYYGIEINPAYCQACRDRIHDLRVKIIQSDFFAFSSRTLIRDLRQVLVLGNPPWVTNSDLSAFGSENLPVKSNFKGFRGIDAITGASNFDICEYIILKLANEYRDTNAVIAMLCKTSVARNVFKELKRSQIYFSSCDLLEFDAAEVFGINANACLLVIQLSETAILPDACNVYDFDKPKEIKTRFGFADGRFYSSLNGKIADFDGHCCFEWRQGIKHDCAKVMELTCENGVLRNASHEMVEIEDKIVFPLIKSSMFKAPLIHSFSKYVIVTQRKVREETGHLAKDAPKTWAYLNDNKEFFDGRQSSIYRGAPPFSMFGVGDYSYSKYKVGVSGFYKQPLFSVLFSDDGKPVMTDDTSYFIPFEDYDMAYIAMLLLNSPKAQSFLTSIAFLDAKRPYTKKVLERIDFGKIVASLSWSDLIETEHRLNLPPYATTAMYEAFQTLPGISQLKIA